MKAELTRWQSKVEPVERGFRPRRIDAAIRVGLAMQAKLCDWRPCIAVVRPEPVIRWHRAGWHLFWRYKSKVARPPILAELRDLNRRMDDENPV